MVLWVWRFSILEEALSDTVLICRQEFTLLHRAQPPSRPRVGRVLPVRAHPSRAAHTIHGAPDNLDALADNTEAYAQLREAR